MLVNICKQTSWMIFNSYITKASVTTNLLCFYGLSACDSMIGILRDLQTIDLRFAKTIYLFRFYSFTSVEIISVEKMTILGVRKFMPKILSIKEIIYN